MGHTTKISDYELSRGDPMIDSADLDDNKADAPVTKSKVVTSKEKKPPVSTTAETKSK